MEYYSAIKKMKLCYLRSGDHNAEVDKLSSKIRRCIFLLICRPRAKMMVIILRSMYMADCLQDGSTGEGRGK
jgi:hypothetical protein